MACLKTVQFPETVPETVVKPMTSSETVVFLSELENFMLENNGLRENIGFYNGLRDGR